MVHRDIGAGSSCRCRSPGRSAPVGRLAYRNRLTVYQTEHSVNEGTVDMSVILGVNGTGGAIESYCAAFIVKQRIFADVGFEPVKRPDIRRRLPRAAGWYCGNRQNR